MDFTDDNSQNSISRRAFMGYGAAGVTALMLPWYFSCAWGGGMGEEVFLSSADVVRLRDTVKLPIFKPLWAKLQNRDFVAEKNFLNNELDINSHVYHLPRARKLAGECALVAAVEEDERYADLARLAIEKVLSFKEWDYFLEGGKKTIGLQRAPEVTISMTMAYDLLNDKLSKAEKADMLKAIRVKGVTPCYNTIYAMHNPDKAELWTFNKKTKFKLTNVDLSRWPHFLNQTNLKAIPISGLAVGAVMFHDKFPEAEKWLKLTQEALKKFADNYEKDGSYPEGVGYWSYATRHIILSMYVLERKFGIDLSNIINFPGTMKFCLCMQMPSNDQEGDIVNFSDAHHGYDASSGYWTAHKFNDGLAQYTAEWLKDFTHPFALFWYDNAVKPTPPTPDLLDYRADLDWIVLRTGWGVEDTVLAMRSGRPSNHEHADRNSIILKAYGERFFNDSQRASYDINAKAWALRHTQAHTSILIEGHGHQYHHGEEGTNMSKAEAKIVQYDVSSDLKVLTSDATSAYQYVIPDTKKIQRTVIFLKPDIILLVDELEKSKISARFQARFQIFGLDGKSSHEFSNKRNTFSITRPGGTLHAKLSSNVRLSLKDGKHDLPPEMGDYPFIETGTAKTRSCNLLTACALQKSGEAMPKIDVQRHRTGWDVSITTGRSSANIKVTLGKDFPKAVLI